MHTLFFLLCLLVFAGLGSHSWAESSELYMKPPGVATRWSSFENPTGAKGMGALENQGGKGHAFDVMEPGQSVTLMEVEGAGKITRLWFTISDRSPEMLRSLKLEMFWDGSKTPAVAAPFGDFFGVGLGRRVAFESDMFSDPEGRSFNCFVPMPFRKGAKIVLTNESNKKLNHLFYDIEFLVMDKPEKGALYFHAHWRRENLTQLGRDFEILPKVEGTGRFLGSNIGVIANPEYDKCWWGEGEFKAYLDGDENPSLVGTGTEDYIGAAWGQGVFWNRYQGCLVADKENDHWAFYRYHIPDPIYFDKDCRVTIQQLGGTGLAKVRDLDKGGIPLTAVSINLPNGGGFIKLLEPVQDLHDPSLPDGWCNFFRRDDVSATAYFYLDSPENGLPELAPLGERLIEEKSAE